MPKTVLIVEDDSDARHIYSTMLRASGFDVLEAKDGREGVTLANLHCPDAIVMNLVLPEVDGISASAVIRSNPALSGTPIIVCTAFLQADGALIAAEAGCDVYLEKPCSPTRLVDEVKRMVGGEIEVPIPAGGR